jgi:glycosyltransferase involved in cell wall biosynthesis
VLEVDHQYVIMKNDETPLSFAFDSRFRELVVPLARFGVREQWTLPGILDGLHLDLFHSLHAALPLRYRGVKVMTVHDIFPMLLPWSFGRNGVKNAFASTYYTALLRMSLGRAALTIVDSEHTAGDLRDHLGCDPGRIRRVYLGIDHIQVSSENGSGVALARYALAKPFLITVTNFKPHKNTAKVLEAFRIVRKKIPGLSLAVIGNDPREFAGSLGRPDQLEAENVRVLGYVSDDALRELLSAAEVFVFPSLYEGFGFPVLEAMAAGTPVVTSAVASLSEVGGDAVMYVDPNDAGSIAAAVLKVCSDGRIQSDLRARGRTQAGRFKWRDTAAQTLGVYEEAVQLSRTVPQ